MQGQGYGGRAILNWAKTAPQLQMICLEGNRFSADIKVQFHGLRTQRRRPMVMV